MPGPVRDPQDRLTYLLEQMSEGAFRTTLDGRWLDANPALVLMLGYKSLDELLATPVAAAYEAATDRQRFVDQIARKGFVREFEQHLRKKSGQRIIVLVAARVVTDEHGDAREYEGVVVDVTDLRRHEEQARQAQKMEAVGRLAGGIAHDFNNLLTAILGYVELIAGASSPVNTEHDLQEIKRAAERGAGLTRQLLAFSRQQVLQPTIFDLNDVVRKLEPMLRRLIGENITIGTHLHDELPSLRADVGQFEQVIVNLAVNARDAMPEGGALDITTRVIDVSDEMARRLKPMPQGRYVRLTVRDTGMGMDATTRTRIFEPFFTTKMLGKGTGLGLSTAYGIVKQSGGFIWVDSTVGVGTTFTVDIPPVAAELTAPLEADAPLRLRGESANVTILLLEDERALRQLLVSVLTSAGYHVLHAESAEEGWVVGSATTRRINLLLTDVVMSGQNGVIAARQFLTRWPAAGVILMSGYPDQSLLREISTIPGALFLRKPFAPADLLSTLEAALQR